MHLDVQDLKFLLRQALGRSVQKILRSHVTEIWPDTQGLTVAEFWLCHACFAAFY